METDERTPTGTLISRLAAKPHGFNLFQAISLLERSQPQLPALGQGDGRHEALRLQAVVSLGFPGSDIARVDGGQGAQARYTLHTGVMTLAGAHGPLPLPVTETVIARSAAKDHASADFLNIFNHRFLSFLYRSRKKHGMGLNWQSPQSSALAGCLDHLSALGLKAGLHAPGGEVSWLRHAGLVGGAPRSMSGLLALLADRFGVRAQGQQFRGGWRSLEPSDVRPLSASARGSRLGRSAVLGSRVWDQSAGITLELLELSMPRLRALLPGGSEHALLGWTIRRYLQSEVTVEIALWPQATQRRPGALGAADGPRLSWTSWLGAANRAQSALSPLPARFTLQEPVAA
jgi:type VI secretion system protein ImpH